MIIGNIIWSIQCIDQLYRYFSDSEYVRFTSKNKNWKFFRYFSHKITPLLFKLEEEKWLEDYEPEEFKECRFDPLENSMRWRAWSEIKLILKFFDVVGFPPASWNIKPFRVSNGAPSIPESPSFSPGIVLNRRQTTFRQKLISTLWRIYGLD